MKKKSDYAIIIVIILLLVISLITNSGILELIAAITGIIYVFLNTKENRFGQLFGIVNTSIYGYLMFKDGLYGTSLYDFLYCVPIQIYTFFAWKKDLNGKSKKEISKYTHTQTIFIFTFLTLLITTYSLLATKVTYTFVDGVSIILGAFGLYANSQKKLEGWYAFIISNIVTIIYWIIKGFNDISSIPMIAMWSFFLIYNVSGLYSWNKKLKNS